ncbi:DegT/DnrJ/EryC1/StrS family aminotransferase [Rhodospirillales bacterium]|nr:DegT/DnrJ/EryC1/StrS family aminotransferase [Rhodospirillales bacterium]
MPKNKSIPIAVPYLGSEELAQLEEVLASGWLTQGPKVAAFEQAFAEQHEAKHAIAVTSCTTGLHLALAGLGVGPGDEVIVPAFTWIATANVVEQCGARPVFADVSADDFNVIPEEMLAKVTSKTRAIIPVHLFGLCADIDSLLAHVPDNVVVIEDAACAAGARYKGRYAGTLGDVGVFSFHPRKTITTGEGGMITTNNDEFAAHLRCLRNHGASVSEEERHTGPRPHILPAFPVLGYNYRMSDLQGAVGLVQTLRLPFLLDERMRMAEMYNQRLSKINWLQLPVEPSAGRHGWQSYVCLLSDAASVSAIEFMDIMQRESISTRPGTHVVPLQEYYQQKFNYTDDDFPGAVVCGQRSVALPLHNKLDDADIDRVCQLIYEIDAGSYKEND